jgi:hypothetical protein
VSTEERDKAAQAYTDSMEADLTRNEREIARIDFGNGWDAHGQVTPDREAIARAICAAHQGDGCKDWDEEDESWHETYRDMAAAVLALFNEKGNE